MPLSRCTYPKQRTSGRPPGWCPVRWYRSCTAATVAAARLPADGGAAPNGVIQTRPGSAPHAHDDLARLGGVDDDGVGHRDERPVDATTDRTEQIELSPDLVEGDDDPQPRIVSTSARAGRDRRQTGEPERRDRELVVHDVRSELLHQRGGPAGTPRIGGEHPMHAGSGRSAAGRRDVSTSTSTSATC